MFQIKHPLIVKLVVLFGAVFVLFFLVLEYFTNRLLEDQVTDNAKKAIAVLVEDEAEEIDEHFRNLERLGKKSAEHITQLLTKDLATVPIDDFDKKYKITDGALRTNLPVFADEDISGVFLSSRTKLDDDIKRIILATESGFDDYAKGVSSFVLNTYLITHHQLIRIYEKDWALQVESDHDFTKDTFYNIAVPQHNPDRSAHWTPPYYDSIWKHWMTSLITPIYMNEKFVGIVGHDVILDSIYKDILTKKLFDSGYGFLFDEEEHLVIHPKYLENLQAMAEMGKELDFTAQENEGIAAEIKHAIAEYGQGRDLTIAQLASDGNTNFLITKKLDILNWYFAIVVPKNEILTMLPRFHRNFILSATSISTILFGVIILFLWIYVISPIAELKNTTLEIQKGNLDKRANIRANDEIGQLAGSFNAMTEKLSNTLKDLKEDIRNRKNTEKALQESEAKFRSISTFALDAVCMIDEKGHLILWNPAAEKMFGYSRQEVLGKSVHEIIVPEMYYQQAEKGFQKFKDTGTGDAIGKVLEMAAKHKDGTAFPIEIAVSPVLQNGKHWAQAIIRDITGRKLAEEALRKSEEQFKKLYNGSPAAMATTSMDDGTPFEANDACIRMFGYENKEEFLTEFKSTDHYYNSDDRSVVLQKLNTEGEVRDFHIRFTRKDGSSFWAETWMKAYPDRQQTESVLIDVTESQMAKNALKESEEKYRIHFANINDVVYSVDLTGNILNISPSVEKVLGYKPEELVGKFFPELNLLAPESLERAIALTVKIFQGEVIDTVEFQFIHKNGSIVWGEISSSPIFVNGEVVATTSVARDITERKKAEEETKKLEEQLRQSQKMDAIGQLAGGVAHDFNNILTGINGYAEIALRTMEKDTALYEDIEEIYKAGQRASELTNQLLAFSRKQIVKPKVVQPNRTLEQSQKMLQRIIGETIHFIPRLSKELWHIRIDPSQLDQILVNLAVNSRDAMPGGGKLIIETKNTHLENFFCEMCGQVVTGDFVRLSVSDTGHGMDKKTIGRVFEPFFTTKKKGKGTGLGLSTVYGVIVQNGGHIKVKSVPGSGTTFLIYLPKVEAIATDVEVTPSNDHPTGTETILIVEDENMVRVLAKRILTDHGYQVLAADCGEKALTILRDYAEPIDMLLTDIVMPGMNGKELFETIQGINSDIKVLYMSGYTDDVIASQGILEEGTPFIQKPFSVQSLTQKMRDILD